MTQCDLSSTDFCTQLGHRFEEDIILLPFTNCFKRLIVLTCFFL